MALHQLPRLGPLFYWTLALAIALCLGVGAWRITPQARKQWEIRTAIARLRHSDAGVRENALGELAAQGADYAPALAELLNDADPKLRLFAAKNLSYGPLTPETPIQPFVDRLHDDDESVRLYAMYSLANFAHLHAGLSGEEEDAVAALSSIVRVDGSPDAREVAATALGEFGKKSESAMLALRAAMHDEELAVRMRAAWALSGLDAIPNEQAIGAFAYGLESEDREVVRAAVCFLQEMKEVASPVALKLAQLLQHDDPEVRGEVARALGEIGPSAQAAIPALIVCLEEDPNHSVRHHAAEALGRMGPLANDAVPVLRQEISEAGPISTTAAAAISRIEAPTADP